MSRPEMPQILIWFVAYLIFAFLILLGMNIHQGNTVEHQKQIIRQLSVPMPCAGGNHA